MSSTEAATTPSARAVSAEQKRLVQETLALIEPSADHFVQSFYSRLFAVDAKLKPLFKGDIKEQGRKLMGMIRLTVLSLDRLEALMPNLKLLGNAHRLIGVNKRDFDTFEEALIWALEESLKKKFTPEVKDAWSAVYEVLAAIIKGE